jgi:hypothetical protein
MNTDNFWNDETVKEMITFLRDDYEANMLFDRKVLLQDESKSVRQTLIEMFRKCKQPKKDYEILNYDYIEKYDTVIKRVSKKISIHSIQRLSDGEIFTVGDNCIQGKIQRFNELNNLIGIITINDKGKENGFDISELKKNNPVLFVTEDGVDVYKGGTMVLLSTTNWIMHKMPVPYSLTKSPFEGVDGKRSFLYFSTEQAAEEYIILNKPLLSVEEIITYCSSSLTWLDTETLKKAVKMKMDILLPHSMLI